ncbi:MAG: CRISPR-associated protein Cas4 [Candidatus Methanoperedens sp.]|nr:CRISPR-associated protein Cas4 [Candidatus Methanoperedens sp.]
MIRVSDITIYHKCPRMCFFTNKGHNLIKEVTPGYLEGIILKELALVYDLAFNSEDKLSILNLELDRILKEIPVIYRNEPGIIDDENLSKSVTDVRSCLPVICSNLSSYNNFFAGELSHNETLQSEKFGMTGSPDRLIRTNDELTPSIIKTGNMPLNGVWQGDRLQLTAYAVLVEEKYNVPVRRGFVEYARCGVVREAAIRRHERRNVLQILEKIKKIQNGIMPEKPKDAPCEYCGFTGMCDVKSTLASRFF